LFILLSAVYWRDSKCIRRETIGDNVAKVKCCRPFVGDMSDNVTRCKRDMDSVMLRFCNMFHMTDAVGSKTPTKNISV